MEDIKCNFATICHPQALLGTMDDPINNPYAMADEDGLDKVIRRGSRVHADSFLGDEVTSAAEEKSKGDKLPFCIRVFISF